MRYLQVLLIVLFSSLMAVAQTSEEKTYVMGTSISLVLPDGFKKIPNTDVFFHQATASSLVFFEIEDVAYKMYKEAMNTDYFEGEGLTFISQESFNSEEIDGEFYLTSFVTPEDSTEYNRLFFVTGNLNKSIVLLVNIPTAVYEDLYPLMINSIKTLNYE